MNLVGTSSILRSRLRQESASSAIVYNDCWLLLHSAKFAKREGRLRALEQIAIRVKGLLADSSCA